MVAAELVSELGYAAEGAILWAIAGRRKARHGFGPQIVRNVLVPIEALPVAGAEDHGQIPAAILGGTLVVDHAHLVQAGVQPAGGTGRPCSSRSIRAAPLGS